MNIKEARKIINDPDFLERKFTDYKYAQGFIEGFYKITPLVHILEKICDSDISHDELYLRIADAKRLLAEFKEVE